jgi:anaerobic C4-dicarboxylate transporter
MKSVSTSSIINILLLIANSSIILCCKVDVVPVSIISKASQISIIICFGVQLPSVRTSAAPSSIANFSIIKDLPLPALP